MKDGLFKVGTGLHKAVLRATKGRLLGRAGGMPVLILTTTGRRSGTKRSTVLTSPICEHDRVLLVASYGGDDRHPAWFLNLRDDPEVTVTMAGEERTMRARVATGEEKAALWARVVGAYRGYARYQRNTGRDIPVVVLEHPG
ncbi:MAG: nitroreductase family deazaflavin-dependent oxidoreductase [Actinomycetota bacterium]|nr:nitroreductase family deazaflavin-dependent oxidoreductase [Actinomycetota bacterium]